MRTLDRWGKQILGLISTVGLSWGADGFEEMD
jgi:hypothetical protein